MTEQMEKLEMTVLMVKLAMMEQMEKPEMTVLMTKSIVKLLKKANRNPTPEVITCHCK